MRVHLVSPNHLSFGTGVLTPRWLYVIAAATPDSVGVPAVIDETIKPVDPLPAPRKMRPPTTTCPPATARPSMGVKLSPPR